MDNLLRAAARFNAPLTMGSKTVLRAHVANERAARRRFEQMGEGVR